MIQTITLMFIKCTTHLYNCGSLLSIGILVVFGKSPLFFLLNVLFWFPLISFTYVLFPLKLNQISLLPCTIFVGFFFSFVYTLNVILYWFLISSFQITFIGDIIQQFFFCSGFISSLSFFFHAFCFYIFLFVLSFHCSHTILF